MSETLEIKTYTDEDLVLNYVETQDPRYFNEIYDRYSNKIYGKCISMLRSDARAMDATQDIFIKLLLNFAKFKEGSRFASWLYSITYNYCIDLIGKAKKTRTEEVQDYNAVQEDLDEISDSELLEIRVNELNEIFDEIKVEEKALLMMKYHDRMSIKELTEFFDTSESAIKMRLKRAREKVVDLHEEKFGSKIE